MVLDHAVQYFICAYLSQECDSLKVCSNGFIVDTKPPVPGVVSVGYDDKHVQTDNTSLFIHWQGFVDIEDELVLPYAHGIKEYSYGIGW